MCTSFAPLLIAIASMARCDSEPLPIEPKLYLPGSFLISATSSATLFTPRFAGTASALGWLVRMVISAMSFAGSYGILENSSVLIASGPPIEMPIGVAVGLGLGDRVGAGHAARARLVLDDEVLPELLLQPVGDQPRDGVGRRARAERHDDLHGPGGPILRTGRGGKRKREQREQGPCETTCH